MRSPPRSKISPQKKPRRRYNHAKKREMILKMESASTRQLEAETGIPNSNLARWKQQADAILNFEGNMKRFHLHGAGRPNCIPDSDGLEIFMHKRRDAEKALTCTHLVNFLKRNNKDWLERYLANKTSGYKSLLKLLQRFCSDHGFSRQKPSKAKRTQVELDATRTAFAKEFNLAFEGFSRDAIINVDETGMHYDMPPHAIWAVRGGSSKISSGEKHSYRMTAVLTVRANGDKLPIHFILRGEPGGRIEQGEFDSYPIGHFYSVQESAWMDERVWAFYLRKVLKPRIHEPTVLVLDNFDPHVSPQGLKIASEECGCEVAAIPPNATSAVQPLDVGIMAPFKRHLRNLWLQEELIEGSDSDVDVDLMTVPAQQKRLVMIHRAIKAWALITPEEIRRSFTKAIPQ
ncbi:hypothetical protein DYB25_012442 [Aphanomyces astaci]|uniref:DDE-1 domain-containing protein n=3 Tax=Aphanomyces astaci TaxID=112090 RepID=A0A397BFA5_APHAT|nr:hypothetical protein DYB25_012442 [Aphanomyces astaci]RHY17541.1 hypothetical protein DYB36_010775 [Aphanomyces astaci]RHY48928.1 hypothetical protein DYB34_008859 [Aphanomyces astaci]RHY52210.1 hypothetical protein DYB30_010242 [Aphanomyces astaci]